MGDLIRAWATHTKGRYADAESSWLWQLWNEPDIGYWKGTPAEFNRLYDFTEAALHEVLPTTPIGGPETAAPGAFLTQFLRHCAEEVNAVSGQVGTRLDLVTFHAKGGVAITNGNVRMDMGDQLRLHRDGFTIVAGFPQLRQTPIIIGEADPDGCAACSTADVPANAYRNSTAYGAYEVAMMKRSLELEARIGVNGNRQCFERVGMYLRGRQGGLRRAVWEAVGVQSVGGVERRLADGVHGGDASEEHLRRREERESGVMVVVVVLPEKGSIQPRACRRSVKGPGVVGLILQGLELGSFWIA